MNWGIIFILTVVAVLFLAGIVLNWWTSKRRPYTAWEMKYVREAQALEAGRPKPAWADDPIAKSIEWTGTSARTDQNPKGGALQIRSVSDTRIEFQPKHPLTLHGFVLLFGVASFIIAYSQSLSVTKALPFLFSCIGFSFVVWLICRLFNKPVVFDKHPGMFWEGKEQPSIENGSTQLQGQIADIYALQLISTYRWVTHSNRDDSGESSRSPVNTYELNLVMKDGARRSIVSRDDYAGLKSDAEVLATFLGRPLWER